MEDFLGGFYLMKGISLIQVLGEIVVREMAILLKLNERERDKSQTLHNEWVYSGKGKVVLIQQPIGRRFHYSVIIGSTERGP